MAKTTKTKVGIKKPDPVIEAKKKISGGKPPKRIRMLMSVANKDRAFTMGSIYRVPHDVPVNTARSWIESGVAEEDKSLDGPKEKK